MLPGSRCLRPAGSAGPRSSAAGHAGTCTRAGPAPCRRGRRPAMPSGKDHAASWGFACLTPDLSCINALLPYQYARNSHRARIVATRHRPPSGHLAKPDAGHLVQRSLMTTALEAGEAVTSSPFNGQDEVGHRLRARHHGGISPAAGRRRRPHAQRRGTPRRQGPAARPAGQAAHAGRGPGGPAPPRGARCRWSWRGRADGGVEARW